MLVRRLRVKKDGPAALHSSSSLEQIASNGTSGQFSAVSLVRLPHFSTETVQRSL